MYTKKQEHAHVINILSRITKKWMIEWENNAAKHRAFLS